MPMTFEHVTFPSLEDIVSEVNSISWREFLETRMTLLTEHNGVR